MANLSKPMMYRNLVERLLSEAASDELVSIPLLAFLYTRPVDGLPLLHSWLATGKDIWFRGYESWREIVEVQPAAESDPDTPYSFGSVGLVKGMGRISMLLFGLLWTYLKLRDSMTEEMQIDFIRHSPALPLIKRVALGSLRFHNLSG